MSDGSAYDVAKKEFDDEYIVEKLTSNPDNRKLIEDFDGGRYGINIVENLKQQGFEDMEKGNSASYLIKDIKSGEIVFYFSLKCGQMYIPYDRREEYTLNDDDLDFVNVLTDALKAEDYEALEAYKGSGLYEINRFKQLYQCAEEVFTEKTSPKSASIPDASYTYSGVEITDFCKNFAYQGVKKSQASIGFQAFWLAIVPKILKVADSVGCMYSYLFAADRGYVSGNDEGQTLIEYYSGNFGFKRCESSPYRAIRPKYDIDCCAMYVPVSELKENQFMVWESFSDIY